MCIIKHTFLSIWLKHGLTLLRIRSIMYVYYIFTVFYISSKKSFYVHATFLISFYQTLLWIITKEIWTSIREIWSKHKSNSISHAWKDIFYRKMIQKNSRRQLQKKELFLLRSYSLPNCNKCHIWICLHRLKLFNVRLELDKVLSNDICHGLMYNLEIEIVYELQHS